MFHVGQLAYGGETKEAEKLGRADAALIICEIVAITPFTLDTVIDPMSI